MNLDSVCIVVVMLLVDVVSAFRAQNIMNVYRAFLPFVSVCLLMVSCLPSAVFFCQCDILDSA